MAAADEAAAGEYLELSEFTNIGELLAAGLFLGVFALTTLVTAVFVLRQLILSLFMLFSSRRSTYAELELSEWPTVTSSPT